MRFMEPEKEYKASEIADALNVRISRRRQLLAMLVEEGKIEIDVMLSDRGRNSTQPQIQPH